jgi:hypothetical protein
MAGNLKKGHREFRQDTPAMQLVSFYQAIAGTLMIADQLEKAELVRRLEDYADGLKLVIAHIPSNTTTWDPKLPRSF